MKNKILFLAGFLMLSWAAAFSPALSALSEWGAPDTSAGGAGAARPAAVKASAGDAVKAPAAVDSVRAASAKDTLGAPASAERDSQFVDGLQKARNAPDAAAAGDGASARDVATDRAEAGRTGGFIDKSIGAEMVFVKGGTFTMGCAAENAADCYNNEKPARSVTLSDFYIGKHEVTQKQWKAVMGDNPSIRIGDSLPVENVSGYDVKLFIDKLNDMTESGRTYRLPTEAEWEYAARGGAGGGNHLYSGSHKIDDVAWYVDNGDTGASRVGSKAPNDLGIHDMSGNVWELVGDWYGSYSAASLTDPAGPLWGNSRVMRGGGWSSDAKACRVSHRMSLAHDFKSGDMGFRLAVGTQELKPATLAQTMLALQPPRSGASNAGSAGAVAPSAPSRERSGEQIDYGEGQRAYAYSKRRSDMSVGIGAFYGGDYGGGIAWADGEELAMPYGGGGTYLFFDAVYAEAFAGYSIGSGRWKSFNVISENNLPDMSRTYLNIGVMLKYPLSGGAFFPLLGVDYEASVSGKLEYANGNVYRFDIKKWRHDSDALSALWFKFGAGCDVNVARSAYLRAEAMYGFRTANTFEKYDARASNRADTRPGHGLTCRVGVGFRLAD